MLHSDIKGRHIKGRSDIQGRYDIQGTMSSISSSPVDQDYSAGATSRGLSSIACSRISAVGLSVWPSRAFRSQPNSACASTPIDGLSDSEGDRQRGCGTSTSASRAPAPISAAPPSDVSDGGSGWWPSARASRSTSDTTAGVSIRCLWSSPLVCVCFCRNARPPVLGLETNSRVVGMAGTSLARASTDGRVGGASRARGIVEG